MSLLSCFLSLMSFSLSLAAVPWIQAMTPRKQWMFWVGNKTESPLVQLNTITSHPITSSLGKEANHFTFQGVVESDEVSSERHPPFYLQAAFGNHSDTQRDLHHTETPREISKVDKTRIQAMWAEDLPHNKIVHLPTSQFPKERQTQTRHIDHMVY